MPTIEWDGSCPDPFAVWEFPRHFWSLLHKCCLKGDELAIAYMEFAGAAIAGEPAGDWEESLQAMEAVARLSQGQPHADLLSELRLALNRADRSVSEIKDGTMSMTKAARRTKTQTPAAAIHDPEAVQSQDISGEIPAGERQELRISELVPSPTNPRKHFEPEALARLAASMRDVGVLQDIVVRRLSQDLAAPRYEIIAGERRYRAAELAGLTRVPCRIVTVSDAQALEIQAVENLHREQLNPFEEAITFKQLIDAGQFTQQSLAERFKITQGQVSNRIRLLELPETWRERMEAGQISVTQARDLVSWAKYPTVIAEIDRGWNQCWKNYVEEVGQDTPGPIDNFNVRELIEDAILKKSRPMHTENWRENYRRFKPTPAQREELQLVKFGRTGERAVNVERWDQLQAAAVERANKKADKKHSEASGSKAKNPKSEAEKKAQFEKRLYGWKIRWLQGQIRTRLERAEGDILILKCLLYISLQSGGGIRTDDLVACLRTGSFAGYEASRLAWSKLSAVELDALPNIARNYVMRWVEHPVDSFNADIHPAAVEALAKEIGVDIVCDWTLEESFLELHTKDQLQALCEEWDFVIKENKRSDLIAALMLTHPPCPAELVEIKNPRV